MEAQRKKEIRSLIHTIPQLIKSHLVNQAFETEKVIATTFEFSEDMRALMANIPQNYIEKVADWYSKLLFKGFNGGVNNAKLKLKVEELKHFSGQELDEKIKVRIPMPYTLSQHLAKTFQDHIGPHLETVPNASEIYIQFKQDLEQAYREGVKEYLDTLPDEAFEAEEESESEEVDNSPGEPVGEEEAAEDSKEDEAKLEAEEDALEEVSDEFEEEAADEFEEEAADEEESDEAFLEEWLSEIEAKPDDERQERNDSIDEPIDINETTGGVRDMGDKKSKLEKDPILADVSENEIIKALEEYTRLPGDADAENILRYELGLPPKKAKASSEDEVEASSLPKPRRRRMVASIKRRRVKGGKVVGPYDTQALKEKVLTALKTHKIDDNDIQVVDIDSIIADINLMSEEEAALAIAKKMEFSDIVASEGLADVKSKADELAVKLTHSLNLPAGDLLFMEDEGDYLLRFAFERDDAGKLSKENETTMTAAKSAKRRSLPKGPQGVLSKAVQAQIEQLAALGSKRTLKDVRKASAKVAAYMGDILKNIRSGRVGISEGTSKLRANMSDVIGEVFGLDGQGYYEYLVKSKRA